VNKTSLSLCFVKNKCLQNKVFDHWVSNFFFTDFLLFTWKAEKQWKKNCAIFCICWFFSPTITINTTIDQKYSHKKINNCKFEWTFKVRINVRKRLSLYLSFWLSLCKKETHDSICFLHYVKSLLNIIVLHSFITRTFKVLIKRFNSFEQSLINQANQLKWVCIFSFIACAQRSVW
jgi:hypothetical protein